MERINSFTVNESNYKFKYVGRNTIVGNAAPS